MDRLEMSMAILGAFSFAYCITDSILSIFFKNGGLNNLQVSLVLSALSISIIVSSPIVGGLAEYASKKFLLLTSILLAGSSYFLIAAFQTYTSFILSQLILGMGVSGISIIALSDLEESIKSNRSEMTSLSFAIQYIGKFIGPLSGGIMAMYYGMKTSIMFSGFAFAILLFMVYFLYKDTRTVKMERDVIDVLMDFKKFLKNDILYITNYMGFIEFAMISARYMLVPLLLYEYGFNMIKIGIIIASFYLLSSLFEPFIGKWIKGRIGDFMLLSAVLFIFSFLLIYASHGFYAFILASVISSIAVGIADVTTSEAVYMSSRNHEEAYGFFFGSTRMGGLFGFLASGLAAQIVGIRETFVIISVFMFSIMLYALYSRPRVFRTKIFS